MSSLRPSLRARVVARAEIDGPTRDGMWRCFDAIYADVARARFDADLDAKDSVILLEDADDGSLQGFSTFCVHRHRHDGQDAVIVYSGDTVIQPLYWGDHALQGAFFGVLMQAVQIAEGAPVYWLLISKGYKTYLLLARNFPSFWPRRDAPTPPRIEGLLDRLCRARFGDAWDPARGTLRFDRPLGRLRAGVAPIEGAVAEDPDVRFFVERNPGHADGEELCCLGAVDVALAESYQRKLARLRGGG